MARFYVLNTMKCKRKKERAQLVRHGRRKRIRGIKDWERCDVVKKRDAGCRDTEIDNEIELEK